MGRVTVECTTGHRLARSTARRGLRRPLTPSLSLGQATTYRWHTLRNAGVSPRHGERCPSGDATCNRSGRHRQPRRPPTPRFHYTRVSGTVVREGRRRDHGGCWPTPWPPLHKVGTGSAVVRSYAPKTSPHHACSPRGGSVSISPRSSSSLIKEGDPCGPAPTSKTRRPTRSM